MKPTLLEQKLRRVLPEDQITHALMRMLKKELRTAFNTGVINADESHLQSHCFETWFVENHGSGKQYVEPTGPIELPY